jgi:hypothetical protein
MSVPAKNPLDVSTLNLDDPKERLAFYRALNAVGRKKTGAQLRAMRDQGIIDVNGERISANTPPDMLDPTSSVEQ